MYILIDYRTHQYGWFTMAYENFKEIKETVIDRLNRTGWYDKNKVDLRSLQSCIDYLCNDFSTKTWVKSTSYKKFSDYRYGNKKRNI